MSREPWFALFLQSSIISGCLLFLVGCEKLPWSWLSKEREDPTATAATTAAQGAISPNRPVVPPEDTLATVNGVAISKYDLEFRIQELKALTASLNRRWTELTVQQLEGLLDDLVNNELVSQEAVARGLERNTDTQRRWEFARRAFFAQEWLRWNQDRLDVSASEVEEYYEQNKLGFRVPERRRLRQLVVSSEDQAKQALAQLLGGAVDFAALAQRTSLASTAAQGGLLSGWVMRANEKAFAYPSAADAEAAGVSSLDPTLEAAAFAVDQVNGLSSYVKGVDGRFHVFQLVERQEERQRPLAEVWDQIKNFLLVQKLQREIDGLSKKADIKRFPEHLEVVTQ